jgi:amino acid permease
MVGVCIATTPLLIVPCSEIIQEKWDLPSASLRVGISAGSMMIAVLLPGFVQILSFVGCACVGMVSFCLPPLFHLKLADKTQWGRNMDRVMLVAGVAVTVVSSVLTFRSIFKAQ